LSFLCFCSGPQRPVKRSNSDDDEDSVDGSKRRATESRHSSGDSLRQAILETIEPNLQDSANANTPDSGVFFSPGVVNHGYDFSGSPQLYSTQDNELPKLMTFGEAHPETIQPQNVDLEDEAPSELHINPSFQPQVENLVDLEIENLVDLEYENVLSPATKVFLESLFNNDDKDMIVSTAAVSVELDSGANEVVSGQELLPYEESDNSSSDDPMWPQNLYSFKMVSEPQSEDIDSMVHSISVSQPQLGLGLLESAHVSSDQPIFAELQIGPLAVADQNPNRVVRASPLAVNISSMTAMPVIRDNRPLPTLSGLDELTVGLEEREIFNPQAIEIDGGKAAPVDRRAVELQAVRPRGYRTLAPDAQVWPLKRPRAQGEQNSYRPESNWNLFYIFFGFVLLVVPALVQRFYNN
jgi:hypothetical protein